jgi:hypothetical protein
MIVAVCVVSMILKKPFQLERTGTLQHYERYERDEGPECLRVFPPIVPGTGQFVAVKDNDYLPEVHPSCTHLPSQRKKGGRTRSLEPTFAQVSIHRDYEIDISGEVPEKCPR